MQFLADVMFGSLIGVTVRLLVAKRGGRLGASTLGGAVGALVGGLLGRSGEVHGDPGSAGFAAALVGAFAVVIGYHLIAAAVGRAKGAA